MALMNKDNPPILSQAAENGTHPVNHPDQDNSGMRVSADASKLSREVYITESNILSHQNNFRYQYEWMRD